ncbi:MAG: nucleoside 2-deoxyribosyltransferase [Lysobacter sp.]|nr:nucleoside 2-deoxyribosyltransferase [Lysobacter sp.]
MDKCFVIQPFDGGKFDKRFEDTYSPALKDADLDPYRVDRDPGISIPIDEIESKISASRLCLADITIDNPNVWFELGYAIASKKEIILLCSNERTGGFPFDVQHRSIIRYSNESARDFEELKNKITARAKAILEKQETLDDIRQTVATTQITEGLEQHELAAIVTVAQEINDEEGSVTIESLKSDMERAGFTKLAATIAIKQLVNSGLLVRTTSSDYDGNSYPAVSISKTGFDWLLKNKASLSLQKPKPPARRSPAPRDDFTDEDIPF